MITRKLPSIFALAATIVLAACESTEPSLFNDAEVTADIAASSGEAIATAIDNMIANEGAASLSISSLDGQPQALTFNRTRTCYDANGAVVAGCSPMSSVRRIITNTSISGDRSGTRSTDGGRTVTWSGTVQRNALDTLTRNFNSAQPPVEQSRTHAGLVTSSDETSVSDGTRSRDITETAVDSIRGVTWNLPRSQNPWPSAGYIRRLVDASVTVTNGSRTETRNISRDIRVDFPADAQGNVVLTINGRTCNLNLVTKAVTNCQ